MKKQWLFLVLSLVSLTLMAVSSYRTLIEDRAPAVHQVLDFSLSHQAVKDLPASSGWTLISHEELTTALEAPESTWTRVTSDHTKTNSDCHLPDNPKQLFLAGVLIDGQQQLVDAAIPPVEANHVSSLRSNLAVN